MFQNVLKIVLASLLIIAGGCKSLRQSSSVKVMRGPKMPTGIFEMGYATDGKIIFSIGGTTFLGSRRQPVGEIYLFSPFGGGWQKGRFTDKPVVKGHTNSVYLPRFNTVLSTGFTEIQRRDFYTFPVEMIDLKTYGIHYLRNNPHWAQGSGVVHWSDKAYVFGGIAFEEDGDINYSSRVMQYDPATGEWDDLSPMPSPRVTYGTVIGNSLYTFGGFDGDNTYADIWRYDLEGDYWETVGYLPYPASHFSLSTKYPYIFLNNVGDDRNIIGRVDIRDGSFKEFETWIAMRSPGSAIVGEHLYIFGGTWDGGRTASNKTFIIALEELMGDQ